MGKHHAQNDENRQDLAPRWHPHDTSEPAREARALAWRFVFDCYFARQNAAFPENPDTQPPDDNGSAKEHGRA